MLERFIPEGSEHRIIVLDEELAPVIARIAEVIPDNIIFELFSSRFGERGEKTAFPVCRVDIMLIVCRDEIQMILRPNIYNLTQAEIVEGYRRASQAAMKALLWVKVGFQGLPNYALSPDSVSWTAGPEHFVSAQERARWICTKGADMYRESLGKFARYRKRKKIQNDCFTRRGIEYLLDLPLDREKVGKL